MDGVRVDDYDRVRRWIYRCGRHLSRVREVSRGRLFIVTAAAGSQGRHGDESEDQGEDVNAGRHAVALMLRYGRSEGKYSR